jgi:hypothetical protein
MQRCQMIRQGAITLLLFLSIQASSQKVIDSLAKESCECIGKITARSSGSVSADSISNCITRFAIAHFDELSKEKELNPGTVEGIREIHARVRKILNKKCEALAKKEDD